MLSLLKENKLILTEAAIVEQLRRCPQINLHPQLLNAPLIYTPQGKEHLTDLYQSYLSIAIDADLPILLSTPTWRANEERVNAAGIKPSINLDAAKFMLEIKKLQPAQYQEKIKIGGLIGPKNDCYKPEQGLSNPEAQTFHQWQIDQLVEGGVDFLIAQTLPSLDEAIGIAQVMANISLPYIISFVIDKKGKLLDGHSLNLATKKIDQMVQPNPSAYMVNCAYPTFLHAEQQPAELFKRLIAFQANASSLDHTQLDGCDLLQSNDIQEWGTEMLKLNQQYGIKILGGCCGTGSEHLRVLVNNKIFYTRP